MLTWWPFPTPNYNGCNFSYYEAACWLVLLSHISQYEFRPAGRGFFCVEFVCSSCIEPVCVSSHSQKKQWLVTLINYPWTWMAGCLYIKCWFTQSVLCIVPIDSWDNQCTIQHFNVSFISELRWNYRFASQTFKFRSVRANHKWWCMSFWKTI